MMSHSPFFHLIQSVKQYRSSMLWAALCSILNQIFDLIPEILLGMAVDIVVNKQESFIASWGFQTPFSQLVFLGALCMVAWTFESIFQYLYIMLWRTIAQTIQHTLRIQAYTHLQQLEMDFFETRNTGELIAIINDDVNQLELFFDNGLNAIIQIFASTAMTLVVFLYTSPLVTLCTLLFTPFICALGWIFQHRLSLIHTTARKKAASLSNKLAHNISGIATIKSYTNEDVEIKKMVEASKNYMRANSQVITVFAAFRPLVRMAIVLGFVSTVVVGGWLACNGLLNVGAYSTLVFLTQRLLWPFTELADIANDYKRSMACAKRVLQLIETPLKKNNGTINLPTHIQGDIRFENIYFRYPDGTQVFENLSFTIKHNTTIAFVGPTGSGKSSIIKLLLGFYTPEKGNIYIDNHLMKDLTLDSIRSHISFVSQEPFLFPGTIYENITYGSSWATVQQIEEAARIAEAHHFITLLPEGYNTIVGERGQKLSGGQKQRISIARAILKRSSIFVFDEATSSVDNETESAIQRSLAKIAKDHTTIIIAHRLSTVRHADNIYVIDNGKIIETGTHSLLIEKKGIYSNLWGMQASL